MNFAFRKKQSQSELPVATQVSEAPPQTSPKDLERGNRSPIPNAVINNAYAAPKPNYFSSQNAVDKIKAIKPSTKKLILVVFVAVVIVAIVLGVLASGGSSSSNEDENEGPIIPNGGSGEIDANQDVFALFPKEFRRKGDMVSVSFAKTTDEASFQGFKLAAEKLSDIIKGSIVPGVYESFFLSAGNQICSGFSFNENVNLTHIRIIADFDDFDNDGPGGLLARAGPCITDNNNGFGTRLAFSGLMTFDIADVDRLSTRGQLTSVVVHEVAHVLGVGTQWSNLGIAQDLVDLSNVQLGNPFPKYIGEKALKEYERFTGNSESFVPIEDGFTNGQRNSAAAGSINGHFDQDALGIELMTFIIQRPVPPLSRISVASFQDVGFLADIDSADDFDTQIAFGPNNVQIERQEKDDPEDWIYMENDFTWEHWIDKDVEWISPKEK